MSADEPLFGLGAGAPEPPPRPVYPPFTGLPDLPAIRTLRALPQWVAWRPELTGGDVSPSTGKVRPFKWVKKPIDVRTGHGAKVNDADTWTTYRDAAAFAVEHGCPGVGIMLAPDDDLGAGDLDGVRDPESGALAGWAADLVALGETFCEVSPSGKGLHFIGLGKPEKAHVCGPAQVEVYGRVRWLAMTGQRVPSTPDEIRPAPATFAALIARVAEHQARAAAEARAKRAAEGKPDFESRPRDPNRPPTYLDNVNAAAFAAAFTLPALWIVELFGGSAEPAAAGGWRVRSDCLGRDNDEDLSLHPRGFKDFGVHDLDDRREGARSAIDLVMEWGVFYGHFDATPSLFEAAHWLCGKLGVTPESLGWKTDRSGADHFDAEAAATSIAEEVGQLDRLNARYCVVRDAGRTRVLHFEDERQKGHRRQVAAFLSFEDFRNFYMNRSVQVGREKVSLGRWWLEHPDRRQYRGLVFEPGAERELDGRLNLWRGWGVEPEPGDWTLMRAHIREVLARGDAAADRYILRWIAWTLQNPDRRAEAALVFKGRKGTGKGTLGNALCRIFGQHATHISSADHLAGRFNGHLRDAVFLFADEAYWPGDKGAEGALKRLVTEPDLFIEAKGKDGVPVANRLHVMMASNEGWIVPAGEDERRFAVFEVGEQHKQSAAWFAPLNAQMDAGGHSAMLHDLLLLDLGDFHPRQVVRTAALVEQQSRGLTPEDQWWGELLETGTLWGADPKRPDSAISNGRRDDLDRLQRRGLYDQAREVSPKLKGYSDHLLGGVLKGLGCSNVRKVMRSRGWHFPPLGDARRAWERRYPGWRWRDPELAEWHVEGGE